MLNIYASGLWLCILADANVPLMSRMGREFRVRLKKENAGRETF
jgi:hypothetical protein